MSLEAVPGPPEPVTMTVTAPLRHLCPFKNERDVGTATIAWTTSGNTLELHALGRYLAGFSEREISHEDLTDEIKNDIEDVPGIYAPAVTTTWDTAGMEIQCSTSPTLVNPRQ